MIQFLNPLYSINDHTRLKILTGKNREIIRVPSSLFYIYKTVQRTVSQNKSDESHVFRHGFALSLFKIFKAHIKSKVNNKYFEFQLTLTNIFLTIFIKIKVKNFTLVCIL